MATSVQVTVALWVLSPILSFLVNKLLSYLDFHLSRKLWELERQIIPSLEKTLADVTEQRMLRGAKDEGKGSESHLQILGELAKDLKSALYDADDVLDLVKYRQTEKKVISGHGKSVSTSISRWQRAQKSNQKLSDLGDKLQECAKDLNMKFWDLLAKLQQHAHPLRATLMQCAQKLNQKLSDLGDKLQECAQSLHLYIHQGAAGQPPVPAAPATEFRLDIEQETATPSPTLDTPSTSNPPTPNALPNSAGSTTGFSGGNQHGSAEEAPTLDAPLNSVLQKTWDSFGFVVSWLRSIYLVLRRLRGIKIARDCFGFVFALFCYFYLITSDLRDWSYKPVGIKNDDDTATDWVLRINEIISLRKRINNIEYILSESKKSCLLNQNSSSSSTSKDADMESSSSCTVKNSAEESTSTQKEIDDLYRSIEKKVFGRDKDREHVSRMLREGPDAYAASSSTSKPYSVIGIYGITGSGKSTLAQYVCDYEKGTGHFNVIMFVLVGKTFSVGDIFRDMLDQINQHQASDTKDPNESQKTESKDVRSLKKKLEKELQDKRFLLVLDDLWVNADNIKKRWILLDVLDAGQSGSRILVTAQKKDAASALFAQEKIMHFPIPDLEEEQYLSMFMKLALEVSQVNSTNYERYKAIGRKFTEKLRRSLIAATAVAARLHSNNSIDFWERIANLDVLNETMGALWWSYQQLGVDIRRCFTYCSIFPKGYRIKRDELVRIWIAQGFVNTRSNATEELEDVGQHYFDELLTFSFLQAERKDSFMIFRIHDLLHELAERVSDSEFYRIGLNGLPKDIPRGVHHLFIKTNNVAEIVEKILDLGNLRTLIIDEHPYDLYRSIEKKVFGRDKDRAYISRMLREGPDAYSGSSSTSIPYYVFGIYGTTGSGKSTLAKYVCDYEKGALHFNPIIFILVGKTFSIGDIFRDVLEQITLWRPSDDEDLKSLKKELEEKLKRKRFLLVLDDVWVNDENQKELDILLDMLRFSAARSGSMVLVTARNANAARALGPFLPLLSIPDLEEEVYLSLLMHNTGPFPTDDDYRKYERIGRKIAKRLGRSPIAAVTVGKQLQRNKSISFWQRTANLEVLNGTMGALWWSYQMLGDDIRRCFAYCCTLPKGYRLKRDELVRIWIAQGFVTTRCNATEELEDIGQWYFDQLLTFSFLEVRGIPVRERAFFGDESVEFTIHDLLHELAERVSGSEFFRNGLNGSLEDIPRLVHHLFIETTNGVEIAEKQVEMENLRTLINKEPLAVPLRRNHDKEKLLERLFMRLTKLRVLIIKQNAFGKELPVPACIDRMKHLRYLGLCFCDVISVVILPSTFSKLYHIEIIDIPFIRACPEDMANLIYLRHIPDWLYFPNIGRLTSLQALKRFIVKKEQGYELSQLKHLNKLGGTLRIDGLDIVESKEEALEAHLTHKERLRRLELNFGWGEGRFGPDVEAEVLEGLCPPKFLEKLEILDYRGSSYPSWMLSRHHLDAPKQLHVLGLSSCSQLASIPEDSQLFIGLRELQIFRCDWDSLPQNMKHLVSLRELLIWCCDKMELLPMLPHSLERISIYQCELLSKTFNEAEHENWCKIQHIPKKDIEE